MRPGVRRRTPRAAVTLALLVLGALSARPAAAQSCTNPSFVAPPAAANQIATAVVAPKVVAVADLDANGLLDFIVGDSANPQANIYGQGPLGTFSLGAFSLATGGIPSAIKTADLNHDGIPDILIATRGLTGQAAILYISTGAGTYNVVTLQTNANSTDSSDIVVLDIDRDGIPDVVIADVSLPATRGLYAFRNNGNGTFAAPVRFDSSTPIGSLAVADLNGDGKLDLVAAISTNGAPDFNPGVATYLGTGSFSFPVFNNFFGIGVPANPLPTFNTVVTGDFNGDGIPDVAIATGSNVEILRGIGDASGTLTSAGSFPLPPGAASLRTADVNRDGKLDLMFVSPAAGGQVDVLLGNGGGGFTGGLNSFDPGGVGGAIALGDFNGDGRIDVLTSLPAARKVTILANQFQGNCPASSFGPAARTFGGVSDPRALAVGDWNGDGRRDLVVANGSSGTLTVLTSSSAFSFPNEPSMYPGFATPTSIGGFTNPRAVAVADFTGDFIEDLAVANTGAASVSIYRGNGTGGFIATSTVGVGTTPVAIGIGDWNDDNKKDLAVVNQSSNSVSIRTGNGAGIFSGILNLTVGSAPSAIAVADFNLDGKPDLAVANFASNTVSICLGAGGGNFSACSSVPVGNGPNAIATGDFDQDGKPDLAVANTNDGTVSILLGNGSGGFAGTTLSTGAGSNPSAVIVTKLNGDLFPDLAVVLFGSNLVRTYLGSAGGFGSPTDYFVGVTPTSIVEGDVSKDGWPELIVGVTGSANYLEALISLGNGTMATAPLTATGSAPAAVVSADFDKDGKADLVFATSSPNPLVFHKGQGNGTFAAGVGSAASAQPRAMAVADFDRDRKPDLAVAFGGSSVQTFKGSGTGTFAVFTSPITPVIANDVAVADFNQDGKADLVVSETGQAKAHIQIGDGAGGFLTPMLDFTVDTNAVAVGVGDFDGNGLPDFVVAHDSTARLAVYLNAYTFAGAIQATSFNRQADIALSGTAKHLAVGDLNGDGRPDLVVDDVAGNVRVLLGNGPGTFSSLGLFPIDGNVASLAIADVNGDGKLDVVIGNGVLNGASVLLGNGTGNLSRPVNYAAGQAGSSPTNVAVGDWNGDSKLDLVVANGGSDNFTVYTDSNCASRRLAVLTEVSSCNTPNVPFTTQPRIGILDDGGSTSQCETGQVTASIVPGTGAAGATLIGPPLIIPPTSGVASYTNLKIDLAGRRYRLGFSHAVGTAFSQSFTQGLAVTISGGPVDLCLSQPASFSAGTGYDTYAWTFDASSLSFSSNVTVSSTTVGGHTLQVTATQDNCAAVASQPLNVNANLSSVAASTPGPTTVCTTCVGGTVTEAHVGGGMILSWQWQYRPAAGPPFVDIPAQTAQTYVINGADFPGPGDWVIRVMTTPTCGSAVTSNEIAVRVVTPLPTDAVQFLTVTSESAKNTLQWVNAPGRTTVRIRFTSGTSSCSFPSDPLGSDGSTFLTDQVGPMGGRDSRAHVGGAPPVTNNNKYCYTVWTNLGGATYGPGRSNSGRPVATGPVVWAFNIGTLALVPPGNGVGVVHAVAMDNSLHAMVKGLGGGLWPAAPFVWMPQFMTGPSQGRPTGLPFTAGLATRLIFLGDQGGLVHAFDAERGDPVWVTSVPLGDKVVAGPSGIFKVFNGFADQVIVGTYNSSTGNVLYALNPGTGAVLWSYNGNDGTTDHGKIGIVSGQAAVDYDNKRAYFASRAFGLAPDNNTVWCVDLTNGKSCWAANYGPIDSGVSQLGTRLYVGTNAGTVRAINALDGTDAWPGMPLVTSDGNVKAYVAPDRLTSDLYFSTTTRVWRVKDTGPSPSVMWQQPFTSPSTPVYAPGDSLVYVGGVGQLFRLRVSDGGVFDSFPLGDGAAVVGSPTLDVRAGFVYVGSEAGIIYAIQIP